MSYWLQLEDTLGEIIKDNISSKNFYKHGMDAVQNRYSLHEDLNTLEYQVYEHNKDKDIQDKNINMNYSFMTDIELNDLKETLL